MALRFTVSAPGKVILHGEHSVVYGKPAVAGVVGIRNYLTLESSSRTHIIINFDLLKKPLPIELTNYNEFLKKWLHLSGIADLYESLNHSEFLEEVLRFVKEIINDDKDNFSDETHRTAIAAVIYLLTGILISSGCSELKYGFNLTLKSGITMGAGLGSSASFGVCLASCFLFYSMQRLSSNFINNFNNNFTEQDKIDFKNKISAWAFCSEKIMHGNPSGLDNTICTFGNVVKFYRGVKPTSIELRMPLHIMLINTGVSRSTAKLVQNVAELKKQHPELIDHILNAMGVLVEDVVNIFEDTSNENHKFNQLVGLTKMNNNLLRSLNVSHSSLEKIFVISEKYGFGAKLTGAGGGGYATIYLPESYEQMDDYKRLCDELQENGFELIVTIIGGPGMEIMLEN